MPARSEERLFMPSSPPHGGDSTPSIARVESLLCPIGTDETEPEADKAGIAIDAQAGIIPPAIPCTGSAKRSNQDKAALMRRNMKQV